MASVWIQCSCGKCEGRGILARTPESGALSGKVELEITHPGTMLLAGAQLAELAAFLTSRLAVGLLAADNVQYKQSRNFRLVMEDRELTVQFVGDDPETLAEALDLSIEKWEFITQVALADVEDGGSDSCPLCRRFTYPSGPGHYCMDCPIGQHTGKVGCQETPYTDYCRANTDNEALAAAKAEVAFLKMLKEKHDNT